MPLTLPLLKPSIAPTPVDGARSRWRAVLLVGLFCVGMFGTAAVVDRWLPMLPVPLVKDKVEWLAQHGDEYDTFFIGSSRTLCHIIPERFDQLMAQAGTPTRSFNLGVYGMRSPEDTYLLETVLAHRRAPLKFVVVEANPVMTRSEVGVHGTLRAVYWHDFKRLWAVWSGIMESKVEGGIFAKTAALQYNLDVYLTKMLSLGRGREQLEARFANLPTSSSGSLGRRLDGYFLDDTPLRVIAEANWQTLQKNLRKPLRLDHGIRASQVELQAKRRLVEPFGGRMVTFAPPLTGMKIFVPDPKMQPPLPCFNFSMPDRYPELYRKENRFDEGHLNQQGAEFFTRRLVEQLVEWQKSGAAPR